MFTDNKVKSNIDKCYLFVSTNGIAEIEIGKFSIRSSSSEKLLCVKIERQLNFDCHVNYLFSKTSKKLIALSRVPPEKHYCHELIL